MMAPLTSLRSGISMKMAAFSSPRLHAAVKLATLRLGHEPHLWWKAESRVRRYHCQAEAHAMDLVGLAGIRCTLFRRAHRQHPGLRPAARHLVPAEIQKAHAAHPGEAAQRPAPYMPRRGHFYRAKKGNISEEV